MAAASAGPGRWVDGIEACGRGGMRARWWRKEDSSGDRALPRHRLRPPWGAGSGPARWWHPDPAMQEAMVPDDAGDAEGQSRGAAPHSGDWVGDWVWAATERSGSGRGAAREGSGSGRGRRQRLT